MDGTGLRSDQEAYGLLCLRRIKLLLADTRGWQRWPLTKWWRIGLTEYDGCDHACPHENILLQNIRQELTHRQAQAAVKVKRYQAPASELHCALYAQDSLIRLGDEISIGWDTYGATSVDIQPFVGGVDLSGSQRIRPLETNEFVLTASNGSQTIQCKYTIVVEPACDVGAHQKVIKGGTGTTLFWNGEGHDNVSIDVLGAVPLKSNQYVEPAQTTTYTLSGFLPGQNTANKTCEYTVYVVPPEEYCQDNPEQ